MTQNIIVDSRYVHLQEANGHGAGITCNNCGYHSILTKNECIEAAKQIKMTQGFEVYPHELNCRPDNPNYCFTNTAVKKIYFTRADCPVHQGNTNPQGEEGLICDIGGML